MIRRIRHRLEISGIGKADTGRAVAALGLPGRALSPACIRAPAGH